MSSNSEELPAKHRFCTKVGVRSSSDMLFARRTARHLSPSFVSLEMPSHQQQYEPASGSDTDSDSSVEQPRRTARRSRDEDEDSIDGLDAAMDEEKLVGAKGVLDVKEEEDPKLKRLRRSWLMASLPVSRRSSCSV